VNAGYVLQLSDIFKIGTTASRPLTPGEIAMARSVFGDEIDYARVRVHRGGCSLVVLGGQPGATAPDGNIYFSPGSYHEDFSLEDVGLRIFFIHEMTHVWQHQQGRNLPLEYLVTLWKLRGDYNAAYEMPSLDCPFENSNLEQQAMAMGDFYYYKAVLTDERLQHKADDYARERFALLSKWIPPQFAAAA
jgi:type VI secretion system secreted protein VgrG